MSPAYERHFKDLIDQAAEAVDCMTCEQLAEAQDSVTSLLVKVQTQIGPKLRQLSRDRISASKSRMMTSIVECDDEDDESEDAVAKETAIVSGLCNVGEDDNSEKQSPSGAHDYESLENENQSAGYYEPPCKKFRNHLGMGSEPVNRELFKSKDCNRIQVDPMDGGFIIPGFTLSGENQSQASLQSSLSSSSSITSRFKSSHNPIVLPISQSELMLALQSVCT